MPFTLLQPYGGTYLQLPWTIPHSGAFPLLTDSFHVQNSKAPVSYPLGLLGLVLQTMYSCNMASAGIPSQGSLSFDRDLAHGDSPFPSPYWTVSVLQQAWY